MKPQFLFRERKHRSVLVIGLDNAGEKYYSEGREVSFLSCFVVDGLSPIGKISKSQVDPADVVRERSSCLKAVFVSLWVDLRTDTQQPAKGSLSRSEGCAAVALVSVDLSRCGLW